MTAVTLTTAARWTTEDVRVAGSALRVRKGGAGDSMLVKLVLLGNLLPMADNLVRLAEELAMIDIIFRGRLDSGLVRGGDQEQLATGVNPASKAPAGA